MGTRSNKCIFENKEIELEGFIKNNESRKLLEKLDTFAKQIKTFQAHVSKMHVENSNSQKKGVVGDKSINPVKLQTIDRNTNGKQF